MVKKKIVKIIESNNNSNIFSILLELSDLKENDILYKIKDNELILYKEIELSLAEEILYKIELIKKQNQKIEEKVEQLYKRIRLEEDFYKEKCNEINKLLNEYSNVINKKY